MPSTSFAGRCRGQSRRRATRRHGCGPVAGPAATNPAKASLAWGDHSPREGPSMRAARIHDWKGVPVVEDLPLPERRSQQTLVRIDAATISHLDLTVRTGEFPLGPSLPYVPGCEGAGTVVESDTLAAGTQVIFRAHAVGLDCDGTWREYAVVPDEALLPVATPVDPAVAATFLTPTTTAAVALFTIGRLEAGQTVLVSGATGAVGSMAVQLAHAAGANVLALVSRSSRLRDLPAGVQGISLAGRPADRHDRRGWPEPANRLGRTRRKGRVPRIHRGHGVHHRPAQLVLLHRLDPARQPDGERGRGPSVRRRVAPAVR